MKFGDESSRFSIEVAVEALNSMQAASAMSDSRETGGILVGSYSEDGSTAFINSATTVTDPAATTTRFSRRADGLVGLLARMWRRYPRQYYLGEWHYHPARVATPSQTDIAQMRSIATSARYHCPEPILFIVCRTTDAMSLPYVAVVTATDTVVLSPCGLDDVAEKRA